MISKKNIFIIGVISSLVLIGICIYLFYNSNKDNFNNVSLPLATVSGRYVKILAPNNNPINIAGIFIYDQDGKNLITNQNIAMANATMNTEYAPANNALDIIFATDANGNNNVNRNINDETLVFQNYRFTKNSGSMFTLSQNWISQDANIAHSYGGENSQDYWQYDFGSDINISAVEIYTRVDCCPERNTNLQVQIINNSGNNVVLLDTPAQFSSVIISRVPSATTTTAGASATSTTVGTTSTTAGATSTTVGATSTTAGATSTTVGTTSTTVGATSTTAGTTFTTAGATSTTVGASATSTTTGATSTTVGATSTTAGTTSTTAGAGATSTTTGASATSTTTGAGTTSTTLSNNTSLSAVDNIGLDISAGSNAEMSMPTMANIPIATPGMITNLLDSGLGIDYLTSQGIGLNSRLRGPSTNIVQTNFSGTSNVYSPYLYYNKGSSEKFIGKLYHPYP